MKEIWKDIKDYEGKYQVSNLGRVISFKSKSAVLILKQRQSDNGRFLVNLSKNCKKKSFRVHRLVLAAFVEDCPEGLECDRIDGDPKNNNLKNLRWTTHKENVKNYKYSSGSAHPTAVFTRKEVRAVLNLLNEGHSTPFVAKVFNVDQRTIYDIKVGRRYVDDIKAIQANDLINDKDGESDG